MTFPIELPKTDLREKTELICGVTRNCLERKLARVSTNATPSEKMAHEVYEKEKIDHYGYFEDFYRLWSDYEITRLQAENLLLREELKKEKRGAR